MYRNEFKYVIDQGTANTIAKKMALCCGYDRNADDLGFYRVSSLYFDDFCNSSLNDNIVGQARRKKFRIRIYNGKDSHIRLEKKVKHDQGGKKESCVLTKGQYDRIMAEDFETLLDEADSKVLNEFLLEAIGRKLRPKVVVDYNRQSFVYEYGDVRITMDHDIRHTDGGKDLFDEEAIYLPVFDQGQIVLEVKYSGFLPAFIKTLVQQSVAPWTGFSKYTKCRTLCY